MKSGETVAADLIVLATGYKRQEELVRKLFGEAVASRVGTIWGFGEEQELRNMYVRTGQPGLWFIAGGLAQCRIGSKQLALQIKAIEEGLLPRVTEALRLTIRRDRGFAGQERIRPGCQAASLSPRKVIWRSNTIFRAFTSMTSNFACCTSVLIL